MSKLYLEGFYNYNQLLDNMGKLKGEIDINSEGLFEGKIKDFGSMHLEQLIKGHFKMQNDKMNMIFFKYNPGFNNANILYELKNQSSDYDVEGEFTGKWRALPVKYDFVEDMKIFLQRIDLSVASVSDFAYLKIKRE